MNGIDMVSASAELPALKSVAPGEGTSVAVEWRCGPRTGHKEVIDLWPLVGQFKLYAPLRDDPELFATVRLAEDGGAIEWADGAIDIAAESLERLASEQMSAEEFRAFLKRNRLTRQAAAAVLGRSLRMIQNYVEGQPVPRIVALACRGYEASLSPRPSNMDPRF